MKKFMFTSITLLAALFTIIACSDDDDNNEVFYSNPKTFVLVHGAFQAPYAWQFTKADLESRGQKVVVVELPGHGSDNADPATLSINAYRDKVVSAINAISGQVILVGHSMGGMVVTAVAEEIPEKIEKLVFVGAFVPANGQSIVDLASTDSEALFGPALIPSADQLTFNMAQENLAPVFLADGSSAVKQLLITNYKAEPSIPFTNPATITAGKFGSVNKYYIFTEQDKAISLSNQHAMAAAAGITKNYSMNTSHCPFLSKPSEFTALLMTIIQ